MKVLIPIQEMHVARLMLLCCFLVQKPSPALLQVQQSLRDAGVQLFRLFGCREMVREKSVSHIHV